MKRLRVRISFATPILLGVAFLFANLRCAGDGCRRYAPEVTFLSCPADTVIQGALCVFKWTGSDRDGQVARYLYGVDVEAPDAWTTAEACTLNGLSLGRHVFMVLAEDDEGRRSDPASCAFTIRSSECSVAPVALDFGVVPVGSYSELTFTVANGGQSAVAGIIEESCGEFVITSGAGAFSLDGGEIHEATVRFSPTSCGAKNCLIDTGDEDCLDVYCSGAGIRDSCAVSHDILEFGQVGLGSFSDLTFSMTNLGCSSLDGAIEAKGVEYSIVSGEVYSLEPGESHDVTVRFEPVACGSTLGSIDIGHAACAVVSCSGSGVGSACVVDPTLLDFGAVARGIERSRTFHIHNPGCEPLQGLMFESCPAFTIESEPAWSLGPGESKEVIVKINPASCEDEGSCWIDLGHELADSVFCTSVIGCGCWVDDEDMYHDFGCLEGDQASNKSFQIMNLGYDTLYVDVHLGSGCAAFRINLGGGYQVIPPDHGHLVVVQFRPLDEPSYTCYLQLGECGQIKLAGKRCGGDTPIPTMEVRCGR